MPSAAPRAWVILAVTTVFAALVVWPSAASAGLRVTGAKIDGVTSTSSPPGSVLQAKVSGRATFFSRWRGTRYRIGGAGECVNTKDTSGSQTVQFNLTAPGRPGKYDAGFTATGDNDCGGTQSSEKVLKNALHVTKPARNPNLPPRCGINVMLVLDESGSIASSGQTKTVKDATRTFLDSLSGTGSKVSIVDFSTKAQQAVGYTTVTPETIDATFEPYLQNGYDPNGWTNWEAAFQEVRTANALGPVGDLAAPVADLVVFITDGDPTARNNSGGNPITNLPEGDVSAMRPAAEQADLVKAQGSHIFALGVGAAVTKPASAARLTAVSGFDELPPSDFAKADYTLVQDFGDLAAALREIALELCEASVTVTKLVDEGDGVYRPDPGWEFTATVSTDPGGYKWVKPPPPPATGARTATTNDEGVATFQWKPTNPEATSTLSLAETVRPGYQFVDADCERNAPTGKRRGTIQRGDTVPDLVLRPNEYYKCTVRNQILPGTIEIEKQANPQGSTAFPFSGSFGDFALVDDAGGSSAARTFTGLLPGTYTVQELVPENWELSGVACTPATAAAITGATTVITLIAGGSVVCTYSDLRVNPPVPPEPPVPPPTPPTPPPPGPPAPPDGGGVLPFTSSSTRLRVVKTAPRVAQVGDRVRFSLTVTNVGSDPALKVRMADIPPAAVTLARPRSNTRGRRVRGVAVWRLGKLAPGASRTVRGSVRIKAGTPGLKRNIVLATAVNARLTRDRADTRVRARRLPRFTG